MAPTVSKAAPMISLLLFTLSVPGATAQTPANSGDSGKDIFKAQCALCHASGGEGSGMGKQIGVKDLRTEEVQKMTNAAITNAIVKGNGNMPPFGDRISKEDLAKLVAFIRTLKQ